MNSNAQAQKGFKTFILTLIISLAVFSAIYYIINSGAIENSGEEESTTPAATTNNNQLRAGVSPAENKDEDTVKEEKQSVFGALLAEKIEVPERGVLAGSSTGSQITTVTTRETTVPVTGVSGPTAGIIISSIILGVASYLIFLGPRKLALSSFEKKVIDDLD
ncbi:hypothetical protein A2V49_02545 [candidate division WWE3 bacterium RBG_19FT_COMBO_34_6]|uniref:Uncharacterized protein n=1 Tax=candidate division WWE3 bacterium RBG_19FT_COMBO_34_6 TaxID=1802612 RepID=A0A1F4ULR5_UNCKA|nr:MAG: hypothetical protein A2V49_02545 [candidate division WWE3 bacterium RBG_19FT_COMBO_34_6]